MFTPSDICENPIQEEGLTLPSVSCVHRFCYPCIDRHLYFRNACPVCKRGIKHLQRVDVNTGEALGRVEIVPSPIHDAQTTPVIWSQETTSGVKRRLDFSPEPSAKRTKNDSPLNCSVLNRESTLFSPIQPNGGLHQEVGDLPIEPEDFSPITCSTFLEDPALSDNFERVCLYLKL